MKCACYRLETSIYAATTSGERHPFFAGSNDARESVYVILLYLK